MNKWLLLPPLGIAITAILGFILLFFILLRVHREKSKVKLRRQLKFTALRMASLGLLLFIMFNPTLMRSRHFGIKPKLVCLIDTSSSMATKDDAQRSRLEKVLGELRDPETINRLNETFNLDFRIFDAEVKPIAPNALSPQQAVGLKSAMGTALFETINSLKDEKQAGIVLISDGRATDSGSIEAARLALAQSIPIWTRCLGDVVQQKDVRLEVGGHELLAFGGDRVKLSGLLHQSGFDRQSFQVELLAGNQVIADKEVVPGPDGTAPFTMEIRAPENGEHRYVFRVRPQELEMDPQNNEAAIYLRVVGEKVRVLLAEGVPNWDSKFLVQTLKRNPRVDMTAVYRLGPERYVSVVSGPDSAERSNRNFFPRSAEEFDHYDVIMLGKGCQSFFDEHTEGLLGNFVAEGGSLIFSRGKAYSGRFNPLAKLEPVIWGEEIGPPLQLTASLIRGGPLADLFTPEEKRSVIRQLTPLGSIQRVSGLKPLAEILVSGSPDNPDDNFPLMISQTYGRGRVLTINSTGLWRWAFHEQREEIGEPLHDRFWINSLRWLLAGGDFLAGHNVALRSDWRLYTDEMSPRFLIRTRGLEQQNFQPQLLITGNNKQIAITPHQRSDSVYTAQSAPLQPGLYTLTLENNIGFPPKLSMNIEVVSASIENRELSHDPELMGNIAEISTGGTLTAGDIGKLDTLFKIWQSSSMPADQAAPLWNHWLVLFLLITLLAAEWLLRRREGLV